VKSIASGRAAGVYKSVAPAPAAALAPAAARPAPAAARPAPAAVWLLCMGGMPRVAQKMKMGQASRVGWRCGSLDGCLVRFCFNDGEGEKASEGEKGQVGRGYKGAGVAGCCKLGAPVRCTS